MGTPHTKEHELVWLNVMAGLWFIAGVALLITGPCQWLETYLNGIRPDLSSHTLSGVGWAASGIFVCAVDAIICDRRA